jgi:hypothetical protein
MSQGKPQGRRMKRWAALAIVTLALLTGCSRGPQHAELGRPFLLSEEPAGAIGIIDYHESDAKSSEVTLVGQVGFKNLKWSTQSAMFMLVDPTEALESGGHVCHDENCPFCKGKKGALQSRAIVMLVDDSGQVPPMDARKLLPLAEGQTAVVSGQAETDEAGQLVVHARGIYLRR